MKPRLKGVYTLNPTGQVMKPGSARARKAVTSDVPGFRKIKRPTKRSGPRK